MAPLLILKWTLMDNSLILHMCLARQLHPIHSPYQIVKVIQLFWSLLIKPDKTLWITVLRRRNIGYQIHHLASAYLLVDRRNVAKSISATSFLSWSGLPSIGARLPLQMYTYKHTSMNTSQICNWTGSNNLIPRSKWFSTCSCFSRLPTIKD